MKCFYKSCVLALLLSLLTFSLVAETQNDTEEKSNFLDFHHALGIFATSAANDPIAGLQYQYWGKRFGTQITVGAIYDPESILDRVMDVSAQAELLYSLYDTHHRDQFAGRLYLWGALGGKAFIDVEDTSSSRDVGPLLSNAILGAGIGIEVIIFDHFSFPLQFGYHGQFPNEPKIGFSFGSGFRYRF